MKTNTLNLEKTGLQELSNKERIENSGGVFWLIGSLVAGLGYIGKKCGDDWQCFKDGLAGRRANHQDWHSK